MDDAPAAKDWGEVLLDSKAYMADKENHTSARCRFTRKQDGKQVEMRVTLCLAPPPRVSYFCCHACYIDDHGEEDTRLFCDEPSMFAMEGDLALITLCHGKFHPSAIDNNKNYYEYLVYRAGEEELTRFPHPAPATRTTRLLPRRPPCAAPPRCWGSLQKLNFFYASPRSIYGAY